MKKNLTLRHRLIAAMPYSLLHFLIEYRCFKAFMRNACNSSIGLRDDTIVLLIEINTLSPSEIFDCVFIWKLTPEGYNFWYRRKNWYKEYLNNLKHYQNEQSRK